MRRGFESVSVSVSSRFFFAVSSLLFCGCSEVGNSPAVANWYGAPATPLSMTLSADPAPGPTGVYRNAKFVLTFDDYPDPDSLVFGKVDIRSGLSLFDAIVKVKLVDHAVEAMPRGLLIPDNQYLLTATSIDAIDGRISPVAGLAVQFVVGPDLATLPPTPTPPTYADVKLALASCLGCHDSTTRAGGLDLEGDPHDPVYGLIGVDSLGRRATQSPLARVSPGDAARSALLRKLIGGNPAVAPDGVTYPAMALDGQRMPPAPAAPVDDATLRLVEEWIDTGAKT